jgi:hypothetical protein
MTPYDVSIHIRPALECGATIPAPDSAAVIINPAQPFCCGEATFKHAITEGERTWSATDRCVLKLFLYHLS